MAKRPNITAEQRERIADLREARWTIPAIAAEVGCSQGSVSWILLVDGVDINAGWPLPPIPTEPTGYERNGQAVRRFTQDEDAELLRLEASGLNLNRIAKALGRKRNAILGRLATLARRDARAEAA